MTAATTLVVSALRSDLVSRAELDDLKTVYLQTVAHDIRGPLVTMGGLASVMEKNGDSLSEDERLAILRRVRESSEELHKMVGDLLAEQRLQAATPDRRPTDVHGLIAGVIDRIDLDEHPIEYGGEPVTGVVDPIEVERIVENLVANAVRHTPASSAIRVAASVEAKGLLIAVDDTGPGVPDREAGHLQALYPGGNGSERNGGWASPWWPSSASITAAEHGSRTEKAEAHRFACCCPRPEPWSSSRDPQVPVWARRAGTIHRVRREALLCSGMTGSSAR